MTVDLAKLIERLKAATGPDRELDLEIDLYAWPASDIADIAKKHPRGLGSEGYAWDIWHGAVVVEKRTADGRCPYNAGYPLPAYTSSIDAAMTLVPEGWFVTICQDQRPGFANVHKLVNNEGPCNYAEVATPALALCIAALKARSATGGGNG